MAIHRFTVDYSSLIDPGSVCSNPTITHVNPENLTIPCSDDGSVDIEINTDISGPHCLTFIIDCSSSCSSCGSTTVTKCFCVDHDDCGECENCSGNLCVSTCATGKVCNDDTCVDCINDEDCLCNQECSQGVCRCEGGLKKRADGCCVECFDDEDLGNCRICLNGTIVSIDCPHGLCNPENGECQECYNNSHCDEPNQCCNAHGVCDCCPGYVLDPVTNECVPTPPCTNAQFCIDHYGPCYYCGPNGCEPIICPAGFTCDPSTGNCVPECGNCPEGSGCINGLCIPCSELNCTGEGLQCQYAAGCECNGTVCEYIDCDLDTVQLDWVVTTGTPGTPVPDTGLPALQGTTSISPSGLVHGQAPTGSTYMNHNFNLAVTNGTSGSWTLYNSPTSSISLGSGTSVSFDLTSTGPNLVGFIVKFTENGTGRTATWGIFRTPTAPLTASDVWTYEFQSTGKAPQTTGRTSGSIQLCATNANFIPTGVTNVQTTGDIVITFFPTGGNCLIASIHGCGTWNGDVLATCGGQTVTIAAPEFTRDPANCCDPTDPNCDGWSDGDPCADLTIQPITLVALPTYGTTGTGDGEFLIVADWTSAGLSFIDLFYLNPAAGCWSTADNPSASVNDIQIVTAGAQSPLGPSVSNLSVVATMGDGGCVRLGHTCELILPGCKKLQGEVCLTECQAFSVDIIDLGSNTYKAQPSLNDEVVTYVWTYPGLVANTGQTVTITPVGGSATLIVTAKYGSPVKCTASDSLGTSTVIAGCTNSQACNYNSSANVDDNSCILIGEPSYDCALGGFQPGTITQGFTADVAPDITYFIGGSQIRTNEQASPGTHTVDVYFNGVQKCSRTLVVPQCYRCNASSVCVPAVAGDNVGPFTSSDCNGTCDCSIEINVTQQNSNNRSRLVITATGDTGTYTVTVNNVSTGAQVLAPTAFNTSASASTPLLCNGIYRVIVTGANCTRSRDYQTTGYSCSGATGALSGVSFDCDTNQLFYTIAEDACADSYNVRLLTTSLGIINNVTYTTIGAKTVPLGVYPGDGSYILRLTTVAGTTSCVKDYTVNMNCNGTASECPIEVVALSYTDDTATISFSAGFTLAEAGGQYKVSLQTTTGGSPGSCTNAVPSGTIAEQTVIGALGSNVVNFPNAVAVPGSYVCYGVTVQKLGLGFAACNMFDAVRFIPSAAPETCGGTITGLTYDTNTGNILTSWDFENTSNDMTVEIRVSPTPCDPNDTIVFTLAGNGENGINIPFGPVHQLPAVAQCATVTIYDTNDPTCFATSTLEIAACTCDVEITEVVTDSIAGQVEVTYTSRCTAAGNLVIDISGDATGSASDNTGSENGVVVTNTKVINLFGLPSSGGTVSIELSDDADVACVDIEEVTLTANCVGCTQLMPIGAFGASPNSITLVRDSDGNQLAAGDYDLSVSGERTSLASALYTGIVNNGGDTCNGAPDISVVSSGIAVTQDDSNFIIPNYAEVTNPYWAGDLKAYFGNCGCETARTCTFTTAIDFSTFKVPDPSFVSVFLPVGANNGTYFHNLVELDMGLISSATTSISALLLSAAEDAIVAAIEASNCGNVVTSASVTYDDGTETLTIQITGTDAGLGIVQTQNEDGIITAIFTEFTQSACA